VPLEKEKQNFKNLFCLTGRTPQPNPLALMPATHACWPHPSALVPSPHKFSPLRAPAPAPPLAASILDKLALGSTPPPSSHCPGPPIGPHYVHCRPLQCLHCCAMPPQCPELATRCQATSRQESRSMASAATRMAPSLPIAKKVCKIFSCTTAATMHRQA
jgi:hypothetical protein